MFAYIEYGIDFDNNKFGFGRSTEIEFADTEWRVQSNVKIKNKRYYIRFWIGKKVFSYSMNDGFKIKNKNRFNFKLVFGVQGNLLPSIHLFCGFMGVGKTTLAKELENKLPAKRYTPDDYMLEKYGRTPDDFQKHYIEVDAFIKSEASKEIEKGHHVILDYGFWNKQSRKEYYTWAKNLTDNVFFHVIDCDIELAKKRTLDRTLNDVNTLYIDESCFNDRLRFFETWQYDEKYPLVIKY